MQIQKQIELIETIDESGTEWGISFTDNNPKIEDYFKCQSKEEAIRLKLRIEKFVTELEFIFANPYMGHYDIDMFIKSLRKEMVFRSGGNSAEQSLARDPRARASGTLAVLEVKE
jgi:hypothetical protein